MVDSLLVTASNFFQPGLKCKEFVRITYAWKKYRSHDRGTGFVIQAHTVFETRKSKNFLSRKNARCNKKQKISVDIMDNMDIYYLISWQANHPAGVFNIIGQKQSPGREY